ncbi:alanine--tRNA ligase [Candidatus Babeliales bacterium]|nr:alanine--tRNA ligase [Candidatus Babeliales bacterium]
MNSLEIRKKFLNFFEKNNHTVVPSSSLIPADDPTLLFANAGMNQFKDIFLGKETRSYTRATSIQKCVRAGGKHNDFDQVGFSERHLTFFEMMGNFSFGDYFKKETIQYAWTFLTKEMNFDPEKLYPSVFESDDESFKIWNEEIGLPKERIYKLGEKDNFWQMGDTGPCGPCSEIYYDRGETIGCKTKHCGPGCDCPRFTEIWNLVFMQYNKKTDGSLTPLKAKGVDTGMGFERLCMIAQGGNSIYESDIFQTIIKTIEKLTDAKYSSKNSIPFHVLSDHVRSSCFIIADGGTPSNEGRGYVLRKIIRRAALFANKLSPREDLFPKLAQAFIKDFSPIYPELKKSEELIVKLLTSEIKRFLANLNSGEAIVEKYIQQTQKAGKNVLTGEQVFKLYDTYGFPLELTSAIAREKGLTVDVKGFEKNMQKQKEQSGKKILGKDFFLKIPENIKTKFVGDEELETTSKILFVQKEDGFLWIVVEKSPFYVESGGQVSDTGYVSINEKSYPVIDLKKQNSAIVVKISLEKTKTFDVKTGDIAHCVVDANLRMDVVKNHTATHLLHSALRQVLGIGIKQAGSLVEPDYLRFDFTYHEALTPKQIDTVEKLVNQKIQENIKTKVTITTLDKAKDAGAAAFFGEKYDPTNVRVVEIPGFSIELCGGTHTKSTGVIGAFKILSESALSTGIRRIVAVTGSKAIKVFQQSFRTIKILGEEFKVKPEEIVDTIKKLQKNYLETLTEIKKLKKRMLKGLTSQWQSEIQNVGKVPFLYLELEDLGNDELKSICSDLEKKTPGFYFLISKNAQTSDKINFIAYLSNKFIEIIDLNEFCKFIKEKLGLRGGGNKTLLQGGGNLSRDLKPNLENWIKKQ